MPPGPSYPFSCQNVDSYRESGHASRSMLPLGLDLMADERR